MAALPSAEHITHKVENSRRKGSEFVGEFMEMSFPGILRFDCKKLDILVSKLMCGGNFRLYFYSVYDLGKIKLGKGRKGKGRLGNHEGTYTIPISPPLNFYLIKDIEVLYLIEPIDEVAIQNLQTYKEKKFVDISKEDLELGLFYFPTSLSCD
ncbi:hypothetical protein RIF29_10011 [Crotalaria pallida]|uniref:Uncharacterized protein n=1 Tax=Crotalaria pallida TaxID=3830 RepID=A0AAN9ILP8_CROPI